MRRSLVARVCALALLGLASSSIAQTTASPDQTFRALDKKWFDAFLRGDGAALDSMEMPDLVIAQPDGSVFVKSGPRPPKLRAQPERTRDVSDFRVRAAGDTAIVTGIAVDKVGKESERTRFTGVWRRLNGEWKVWSYQGTPVVTSASK